MALVGVLAACAGAPTSDTASGADPAAVPASGDPAAPAGMLVDRAAEGGETAGETELDAALARVLEAEGLSIRIEASGAGETLAETIEFSRTGAGARAELVEQLGDATPTRAVVVEDAEAIELVAGQLEAWRHLASAFTLAETEPGVWRSVGPELAGAAEAEIRLQDGFPRRVVMTVSDGGSPVVVLWTIERRG
ncbi:MAG: hypothetical protein D6683_03540 [Actinomyces sp.]|nr:MAG: hypothetical protein D6683_03540 [Actinomyces sp.]